MTDPNAPSTPPRQAPKAAAPRWTARDLSMRSPGESEERVNPAVLQAAMRASGKADLGSPDEVKALVDAYLKQPVERTYP